MKKLKSILLKILIFFIIYIPLNVYSKILCTKSEVINFITLFSYYKDVTVQRCEYQNDFLGDLIGVRIVHFLGVDLETLNENIKLSLDQNKIKIYALENSDFLKFKVLDRDFARYQPNGESGGLILLNKNWIENLFEAENVSNVNSLVFNATLNHEFAGIFGYQFPYLDDQDFGWSSMLAFFHTIENFEDRSMIADLFKNKIKTSLKSTKNDIVKSVEKVSPTIKALAKAYSKDNDMFKFIRNALTGEGGTGIGSGGDPAPIKVKLDLYKLVFEKYNFQKLNGHLSINLKKSFELILKAKMRMLQYIDNRLLDQMDLPLKIENGTFMASKSILRLYKGVIEVPQWQFLIEDPIDYRIRLEELYSQMIDKDRK